MKRRWGVFLDRDGTLLRLVPYLHEVSRAKLYSGVPDALLALRRAGARLVVVTNQSGVARGIMSRAAVDRVNRFMRDELRRSGVRLDGIEVCVHQPEITGSCSCRKPAPGMLVAAASRLNLDLSRSWMIGDNQSDLEAGQAAGTRVALVRTGYGKQTAGTPAGRRADVVAGSLGAAARRIIELTDRSGPGS